MSKRARMPASGSAKLNPTDVTDSLRDGSWRYPLPNLSLRAQRGNPDFAPASFAHLDFVYQWPIAELPVATGVAKNEVLHRRWAATRLRDQMLEGGSLL